MKVKAALIEEKNSDFKLTDLELDDPKEYEVLTKIIATGICHSDVAGKAGLWTEPPLVLGHEGAGIVQKVGEKVTNVQVGDHVVLSVPYCDECDNCQEGNTSLCLRVSELSTMGTMRDGTSRISKDGKRIHCFFGQSSFTTYAVTHYTSVIKIDQSVPLKLMGPLGCGFQTGAASVLEFFKAEPGSSIAVFGCGSVGLAAIMAAKIAGCKTIIAVGGTPPKLELALEIGATHTINRLETPDIPEAIRSIVHSGVNYSIDTTGNQKMIDAAIYSLTSKGQAMLHAVGADPTVPVMYMMGHWINVGSAPEGGADTQAFIPRLVQYYKDGLFPVEKLISFYQFNEIEQAFADMNAGKVIKPVLLINEE
ncbi:NAD(P)-dependent alcohol dehydrogenase [Vagococcus sp. BWB3-3]|uniref:NAD(P)-dependent alcohol dehydrogenase n=1 Tax=Vagococcus allomyrinae TaxID=2794353 RepID=A0A940P2B6_9ENTE|nr:NAD(P)-dependent alcohol dehydrogenase [Vagococcus allomyrinae]MBP1040177.1 NAD(P)-dependent alcohol dehydrogenase [Vagococcus allomyrinae]